MTLGAKCKIRAGQVGLFESINVNIRLQIYVSKIL